MRRQRGPETTAGEALRYLAELPFVPYAIAHNGELEWREVDESRGEVAASVNGWRLTVAFELNGDGDIVGATSEDRTLKIGDEWQPTPWGGRFGDYEMLDGIRLPTTAEAYWDRPEGRYAYWRGTILSAQLVRESFGSRG